MTPEVMLAYRMHGLYLTRKCEDLTELSRELMGLHCWFHRNVVFSGLIRGAEMAGWKTTLTKTWLYRGTLHGAMYDDLPGLLALHPIDAPLSDFESRVLSYMEDGVFSRAEFRRIFRDEYDEGFIERAFSPWGGVFVGLARRGLVAFRDMTSRDFDMIDAEPDMTRDEALPGLLRRYFAAYGPATVRDAAWFFGYRDDIKRLAELIPGDITRLEMDKTVYYYLDDGRKMSDIPEILLLSGFDPLIVSYTERGLVLPSEYKPRVIMKSGICLPTVLINGRVAGIWNIKNNDSVTELFETQPKRVMDAVADRAEEMRLRSRRYL